MSGKRQQLENAATEAVQRSGFHHLSFRTLANEVGVKSSSVHYYFPEKADLASALITAYSEAFEQRLEAIGRDKKTLRQKLDSFVRIFDEVIEADKFCLCGMLAAEIAVLNDKNKQLLLTYFNQAEEWLHATFKNQQDELATSLEPLQLARIVMSGLEGAILIDRVDATRNRLRAQHILIRSFTHRVR